MNPAYCAALARIGATRGQKGRTGEAHPFVFRQKTKDIAYSRNSFIQKTISLAQILHFMKKMMGLALLFCAANLWAQAVKPGESLTYTAAYNMSGLLTPLAQVKMETENVKTSKNTLLHLSMTAATYSKWDSFFKIRDSYESYVTPGTFKPALYKRDIFEGGYTKKEKYLFKGTTVKSTVTRKKQPETTKNFNIADGSVDAVTLLYKLRNVDFSKFKPGQTANFTVVFDEKQLAVSAKYMGRETVKAGNLGSKECYKISIAAKTQALKGTDKNIIWLTADAKRIPTLVKFSIAVGTGQLSLTNASGI